MREKIAEIIELIEKADQIFKGLDPSKEEARTLWDAGVERLAGALWLWERKEDPESAP